MRMILCSLLLCLASVHAWAQDTLDFQSRFRLSIAKSNGPVSIDGLPNEPVWSEAPVASGFREKWPNDRDMAKRQTLIRSAFDDTYLYFFIVAYDTSYYVAQTLKRDAGLYDSDAISSTELLQRIIIQLVRGVIAQPLVSQTQVDHPVRASCHCVRYARHNIAIASFNVTAKAVAGSYALQRRP